jgi:hypothetical protein
MYQYRYPQLWHGCIGAWCPSVDKSRSAIVTDYSAYRRDATGVASSWSVNEKPALIFSGSGGDQALSPTTLSLGSATTIACWCRTTASSTFKIAFGLSYSVNGNPFIAIGNGNTDGTKAGYFVRSDVQSTDSRTDSTSTLNDGYWHHLAVTVMVSGGINGYFDGRLQSTASASADTFLTINRASIGNMQRDAPGFYFNGHVDDCRAYNRELTQSEIQTLALRRGISFETKRNRFAKRSAAVAATNNNNMLMGCGF